LRRCRRSRIHLRMFRLVTQITGLGQCAHAVPNQQVHDPQAFSVPSF
jgi:hypothetical protein